MEDYVCIVMYLVYVVFDPCESNNVFVRLVTMAGDERQYCINMTLLSLALI